MENIWKKLANITVAYVLTIDSINSICKSEAAKLYKSQVVLRVKSAHKISKIVFIFSA